MEVLINELSLHKQFGSVSQFIDTALPEFLKMYALLDTMCIELLKSNRLYASHITTDTTLHDVMILKNVNRISDELRKFKQLVAKCIDAPYWEDNKQHTNTDYKHNQQNVTETSLAEAYARNAILVSFAPSDFEPSTLEVISKSQSKPIFNFTKHLHLAKHAYTTRSLNFHQFCKHWFTSSKLCFDKINVEKSFGLIKQFSEEREFLSSFELFIQMSWPDILAQGGKGKKDGLAYGRYHNQEYFENYKVGDVCKFRCSSKFRAFGYRKGEVFYLLEFDLTHRLSD